MAEVVAVLGLIASVVSIIDGIGKTKTLWKTYFNSSTSLRAELLPILGKLTAFAGILRGIQVQCELDEADAARLHVLAQIEQPLKASEQAVQLISARLDQIVSLGRVSFSFGKVLNKETTAALHILDQAKSVLDLALAADQITLTKSIEAYVRNVAGDLHEFRLQSKLQYHDVKQQLREIKAKATDDVEAKNKTDILAWISQTDYSANYEAARQPTRPEDTSGNWFIASDIFQDWVTNGKQSRLLIIGISGSGKTVLCAKAIEYLAQRKVVSGIQPTILYYFFDFNDAAKESVEGMIRALISQLLLHITGVPKEVQTCYDKQREPASTEPVTQRWTDLLCNQMHALQDVFIFIDALDECTESETSLLTEILSRLFSDFGDNVRWLLTCRPNARAINGLQSAGFQHIEMISETVDRDIETYLTACLKGDAKFASFSNNAKDCIITGITSKSSGMFRYAQCQLEAIAKLRDRRIKKVKEVLELMPRTISECYHRILSDAQQLDDWPLVERILLLVSFSTRPVTVTEVSEFAILEHDTVSLDPEDRLDMGDILASINTMITVREGVVTLAHKSVQEFFEASAEPFNMFHLWQNADNFIATRCLQYLRIPQEPVVNISGVVGTKEPNTTQLKYLLQKYPFLDYAAHRWPQHLREKQQQQDVIEHLAATLPLIAKPNLWKAWLLLQRADIWENQIQLAGILCEAFIRGGLVTSWSLNFWQQRQHYRVRNDTDSQNASEPLLTMNQEKTHDRVNGSSGSEMESSFWVKAIEAQSPTYALPTLLSFEPGDLIFILQKGMWWQGVFNGQTGTVASRKVEPCRSNVNHFLSGQLFHELAVLLLEVAFQRPLAEDAMTIWTAVSSAASLGQYLRQLKALTRQASRKMGSAYGDIIKQCLSSVHWPDDKTNASGVDVLDSQESCMEKIHQPMLSILASGFRASRRPIKRATDVSFEAHYGRYISSTTSAPAGADYRYGPPPPAAYDRAQSTAAVVSQTAAYYSASVPTSSYRPHSTTAVAVGYRTSVSAYAVSGPIATNTRPFGHTFTQSPAPTSLPASGLASVVVPSTSSVIHNAALPVMTPVIESKDETSADNIADQATDSNITANNTSAITNYSTTAEDSVAPQYQHLFTEAVDTKHLSWSYPNHLTYNIFADLPQKPVDIQLSDDDIEINLEAEREAVLKSGDVKAQLTWASHALAHVDVAENNGIRACQALSIPRQVSSSHQKLRRDAVDLVTGLAAQGHPQAIYIRAKWWEFGTFDHEVDRERSLLEYKLAADQDHAASCYRAALLLEAAGKLIERDDYYARGAKAGSVGVLYRQAMSTMQGINGEIQDVLKGMRLLLEAATLADTEAPQALYVAGLMFAHEQPFLDNADNPVSLDNELAATYFKRAALCGFAKAQLRLGIAYELGQLGLSFSIPLSLHYYISAARRGEAEAEMGISKVMLVVGHGDASQQRIFASAAYTYAKRAALNDLAVAQFALGYCHELGIHVAADKMRALEWYEKAGAQGFAGATERLATLQSENKPSKHVIADNASQKSWQTNDDQSEHPSKLTPSVPKQGSMSSAQQAQTSNNNGTFAQTTEEDVRSGLPHPADQLQPRVKSDDDSNSSITKSNLMSNAAAENNKRRTWLPKLAGIKAKLQQK